MFRRYNRWHSRFDQPDPYEGSYELSDPQSFNRYAYTQNDPANFVDPSGLLNSLVPGGPCPYGQCVVTVVDGGVDASTGGPPEFGSPVIRGGGGIGGGGGFGGGGGTPPQNSFAPLSQGWHNVSWTKCPPVQFKITGIAPGQAPGKTVISQHERADIPNGGVAIKPRNFGVKGINGNNRSVFLNMRFSVDWTTATPAGAPGG